ncbi:MAG: hypothetical protein QM784_17775 [Polyangiaceae bacterium]
MRSRYFGIIASLLIVGVSTSSKAECPEAKQARDAYERGERALGVLNVELAVKSFSEANQLCPNPHTQLAIANAYLLGKHATEATMALKQYISDAAATVDWCLVLETRRQIAELEGGTLHRVHVQVYPTEARIYLRENADLPIIPNAPGCPITSDRGELTLELPTGSFAVAAQLEDYDPVTIMLDPSNTPTLELSLSSHAKAPEPVMLPPAPDVTRASPTTTASPKWYQSTENWIWIGSGLVGIASATAGIWAWSMQSDLDHDCPQRKCPEGPTWSRVDRHDRLALISTAGFVVTGVGALAGVGVHFALRSPQEPTSKAAIDATLGPGQMTLRWRF